MTLQQVNLYQDELKTKTLRYSSKLLLQISIVFILTFSFITGFSYYQLQQHEMTLAEYQLKQKTALSELQKLQQELALRKKDMNLARRLTERTAELANKQKVLNILSRDEFGNTKGFIEHVSGLARQRIEGLWLTKIRIANGGTDVALHGITLKAELVPKYLQRLSSEKVFAGTEFESLSMVRQKKKKQWLDFSLKNKNSAEAAQ